MFSGDKGLDFKYKSEMKYKTGDKQHEFLFAPTNKDYTAEWEYEPAEINKDGVHASVNLEGNCAPLKSEWGAKAEFKLGGFKVGPISPWNEVQLDTDQSKKLLLTLSQNLIYKEYNVAWKAVLDANAQKLNEAYGLLALKN
jgi:hypothetical protein